MKRVISLILIIISLSLCLSGCEIVSQISGKKPLSFEGTYTPTEARYGTDEQIYITIDRIEMVDGKPIIHAIWHNESDRVICFGVGYKIERLDGDSWTDVMVEDFAIIEIACMMNPGESGEHTYRLEYFDVTSEGSYRILVDYSYSDEQGGSGSTYAIFEKAN